MPATICSTILHISVIACPTISTIQSLSAAVISCADSQFVNFFHSYLQNTHTHPATVWYGTACSPQTCYNFLWHSCTSTRFWWNSTVHTSQHGCRVPLTNTSGLRPQRALKTNCRLMKTDQHKQQASQSSTSMCTFTRLLPGLCCNSITINFWMTLVQCFLI